MIVRRAETDAEINEVRRLFREYAESLGVDLCFQGFEEELAGLPGTYGPPGGSLLIAEEDRAIVGCVALRKLGSSICEMKRLYVKPQFRGRGLGKALVERIIEEGTELGYTKMRLDTLDRLKEAMAVYEAFGFRRIEPYYVNPLPDVVYWELDLQPQ